MAHISSPSADPRAGTAMEELRESVDFTRLRETLASKPFVLKSDWLAVYLASEVPLSLVPAAGGPRMPYLRLYARELPIERKRVIALELIDITLRTLKLRADQRYQTSVQFVTQPQVCGDDPQVEIPRGTDFVLEVSGHDLTEEKKRAFAREAAAMLRHFAPAKLSSRIARVLGTKANSSQQIALQFNELSPATSDPFLVDSQPWAA